MTKRLDFLKDVIDGMKKENLFSELPVLNSQQQARVKMNGKDVLTLSTNNYLGFANHPRLVEAAKKAMEIVREECKKFNVPFPY